MLAGGLLTAPGMTTRSHLPVPTHPCLALLTIWVVRLPTSRAHLLPAAGPDWLGVFTVVVSYDVRSVLRIFLGQAVYGREKHGESRELACSAHGNVRAKLGFLVYQRLGIGG